MNPIRFSSCAQLNTRRLWNADGTVHAAFHGLADILLQLSIYVVCIQETHAPDFASLPGDQPFVYDGPSNTGGFEAWFFFHESIRASTVPGVTDTQRTPWRLVSGLVCVCSFYAPHVGMDDQFRSLFWQELVASVKHTQRTLPDTPIVLSGDANVWWPEFHLGRERPRDRFIFPYIRELLEGCGLSLRNPLARTTHVAGAALDMVFISEECVTEHFIVHQGDGCCSLSPSCCPALGSDHFLCHFFFLRYYKVSVFGMHRAQLLFQLSEIGNQYFLLPVLNRQARFLTICSGSCGSEADTPEANSNASPTSPTTMVDWRMFSSASGKECGVERLPQIKPPSRLCSFLLLSALLPPACPFHPSQLLEILARRHFVDAHSEPTSVCQSHQEVFSISDVPDRSS